MRFGGLQKNSFIDFPGKISCVVFASGCNFKCPYCHNPALVRGGGEAHRDTEVVAYLKKRAGWLEGVVISGGEPTLQRDLPAFCQTLKSLGYPVKLDTNGSRPAMIASLLKDNLVDYIAMDIKTDPDLYVPLVAETCPPESIRDSISLIMGGKVPYEFKTTCVKPIVDESIMDRISRLICGADRLAIQRFVYTEVLDPEFFSSGDCHFSEAEFSRVMSIAKSRVKTCVIR